MRAYFDSFSLPKRPKEGFSNITKKAPLDKPSGTLCENPEARDGSGDVDGVLVPDLPDFLRGEMDLLAARVEDLHDLVSPIDVHRIDIGVIQPEEIEHDRDHDGHQEGETNADERVTGRGEDEVLPPREMPEDDSQAAEPERRSCILRYCQPLTT